MITKEETQEIVDEYGDGPDDTGKPEVQIAIFTKRIERLTEHLKDHPNDNSTRHGLLNLVGKRRSLLDYLRDNEIERYRALVKDLNLRR